MTESKSVNQELLIQFITKKVKGEDINLFDIVRFMDADEDCNPIKEWVIKEKIATPREWNTAVKQKHVFEILGGTPKTVTEFLELWIKKYNVKIDYKKQVEYSTIVMHGGENLDLQIADLKTELETIDYAKEPDKYNNRSRDLRVYQEIRRCKKQNMNINDISRKLRIIAKELELNYSATDIDDVLQEWIQNKKPERVADIFSTISYANPTRPKGMKADYIWGEIADSLFDQTTYGDLSKYAKIAVMKKFIWQIKRKMQNLPVTNHLMPVLVGPQGSGKSTFMWRLIEPVAELSASTDFHQVTDDRNIDLWSNYVLVLDEMGWAAKSDIELIKNIITSSVLNRRYMRTNNTTPIKQNATFIGASNKELDQVIRDETGLRRFAEIRFTGTPDWDRANKISCAELWMSVDETAEDPTMEYIDELKSSQERARASTSCEEWINSLNADITSDKSKDAGHWFILYKNWEKEHYSKRRMDLDEWNREMRRLISTNAEIPFIINDLGYSIEYQFIKSRAELRNQKMEDARQKIEKTRVERDLGFTKTKIERTELYKQCCDSDYDSSKDADVLKLKASETTDTEVAKPELTILPGDKKKNTTSRTSLITKDLKAIIAKVSKK